MNALVWAAFPASKRALHHRQADLVVLAAPGESLHRPRELDTLALLDEGGVVVASRTAFDSEVMLAAAIEAGEAAPLVFGHAIYEGIVLGREPPVASVVWVRGEPGAPREALIREVDHALAAVLGDRTRLLQPSEMLRLKAGTSLGKPVISDSA
jgi:hypothetical protein